MSDTSPTNTVTLPDYVINLIDTMAQANRFTGRGPTNRFTIIKAAVNLLAQKDREDTKIRKRNVAASKRW